MSDNGDNSSLNVGGILLQSGGEAGKYRCTIEGGCFWPQNKSRVKQTFKESGGQKEVICFASKFEPFTWPHNISPSKFSGYTIVYWRISAYKHDQNVKQFHSARGP